jgi:amino acid transporter
MSVQPTPQPPVRAKPPAGAPVADPAKLAEELRKQRKSRPLVVLSGCLLVSFLCGALFVTGIVGAIAVARALGWQQ